MRDRTTPGTTRAPRRIIVSVDLVLFTPRGRHLALLLQRAPEARARERWTLPWDLPRDDESVEETARRLAERAVDPGATWLEQIGAVGELQRHPGDTDLSIAFVGVAPLGAQPATGGESAWFTVSELPALAPRQAAMVERALDVARARLDRAPIAFRLLPPTFTLSELQQMYEILLGRRLHKASFRRALQAAWLVEPTDEWRSEGRGRPAQLFRYAPRRRRNVRRGVRFEITG
jgi:8-oxo-dGTP diphosphatase